MRALFLALGILIALGGTLHAQVQRTQTVRVNDRTEMAALSTASFQVGDVVILEEGTRGGFFKWSNANAVAAVTSDPGKCIYVPPASASTGASGAWIRQFNGVYRPEFCGAVGDGVTNDTAAVQAMWNLLPAQANVKFTGDYLLNPINAACNYKWVDAGGAKFTLAADGVLFNLNPDADPTSIDTTTKSYCYWTGGLFTSTATAATNRIAMRAYAIRQFTLRDAVFGESTASDFVRFSSAVQLAGLGAHLLEKNRFLENKIAIHVPDWSGDPTPSPIAGIPVSTSSFIANEFILIPTGAQKAFEVVGGWNRWNIIGGFVNGSNTDVFHFTNDTDGSELLIQGVGFEQASTNSRWIYLEDTDGVAITDIRIRDNGFSGNPNAGGHTAIQFERVNRAIITGNLFTTAMAAGPAGDRIPIPNQYTLIADAQTENVSFSPNQRFDDGDIHNDDADPDTEDLSGVFFLKDLAFDAQTANFTVGATLTGATSGATGIIFKQTDAGATGTLSLRSVKGVFSDNEIVTAGSGSATADIPSGIFQFGPNGSRSFVQLGPRFMTVPVALSGFNGVAFSTVSTPTLIDVSAMSQYPDTGIDAIAVGLRIMARDTGSATGNPIVKVGRSAAEVTTGTAVCLLALGGLTNNSLQSRDCLQALGSGGRLYYTIAATGASTLDLWLYVTAIYN